MMKPKEIEADKYAALAVPAIGINRFFIAGSGGIIRIIVGEKFDNEPANYHAAFNISLKDASELVNVLQKLIAQNANVMPQQEKPQ